MTKEELAEEYVRNKADKGNFDLEQFGKAYFSESSLKQAFLAGYETMEAYNEKLLNSDIMKEQTCSNCKHYAKAYELCCYSLGDEDYDCRGRKWEKVEND